MKRATVKKVFIGALIFLPLHYAAVGIIGVMESEPWPAFVLPAFKSVFSAQDQITVRQLTFYVEDNKNAELKEIQPEALFRGINNSQLQGFFRTHFSDSARIASFSGETRAWLKNKIDARFPSADARRLRVRWVNKVFESLRPQDQQIGFSTTGDQQFSIPLKGE